MFNEIHDALSANNNVIIHVTGGETFSVAKADLSKDKTIIRCSERNGARAFAINANSVTCIEVSSR